MPVLTTVMGKWKGGPNDNVIRVEQQRDGKIRADWTGKSGGRGGFEGTLMEHGKTVKGYWYDLDTGVTEGHRYECTIVVTIDEQADSTGNTIVGKWKGKDGASGEWTAKRHREADVGRTDGKISTFAFKSKATFERVTDNLVSKRAAWAESTLKEVLETTGGHKFFDGAIEYIPGPAVGDLYMNSTELNRTLRQREEAHRVEALAAMEAEVERLAAKAAAGTIDDNGKRRLEIAQKLIKGAKAGEKLEERPKFKPTSTKVALDSEKPAEHLADPFLDAPALRRKLRLDDEAHWKNFRAALEAEIPRLEAKIAKGDGDVDGMKRRLDIATRLLKGEKTAEKLVERAEFKPSSGPAHMMDDKPYEYLADKYLSGVELERKLKHEEDEHEARFAAALEVEIPRLEAKIAKGDGDVDGMKRRLDLAQRLLKGSKQVPKLRERPKFKPNPPDQVSRMSGTVMLHPRNVRAAIRSMSVGPNMRMR